MIIRALLLIILLVVGTVLVIGLFRLGRSTSKSITIASFTETGANTREDKSRGLGHDIADALEFEVLRIAQLHALTNPWGSPKELPSLQMTGPQTVERGGDDQFGGHRAPSRSGRRDFETPVSTSEDTLSDHRKFPKISLWRWDAGKRIRQ
jgi:hypothetical protein